MAWGKWRGWEGLRIVDRGGHVVGVLVLSIRKWGRSGEARSLYRCCSKLPMVEDVIVYMYIVCLYIRNIYSSFIVRSAVQGMQYHPNNMQIRYPANQAHPIQLPRTPFQSHIQSP